jgi:hypothetical protein
LERDVLQQDDLVIAADLLERSAEVNRGVLCIALGILTPRAGNAAWRVEQPFAFRVIASPADQRPDRLRHIAGNLARRRLLYEIAVIGIAIMVHA